MELRELKREVETLEHVGKAVSKLEESWLIPLQNARFSSSGALLARLSVQSRQEIEQKAKEIATHLDTIRTSQIITDKLQQYARFLVELKLNDFRGDKEKSRMITKRMLEDDFFSLSQTIGQVEQLNNDVDKLNNYYQEINDLLHRELSLEETVFYLELPHRKYLANLQQTAQKHAVIVRDLGHHFVSLTSKNPLPKEAHR